MNASLARLGFRLDRLDSDFDDQPVDAFTRGRIVGALASSYESWLACQSVFEATGVYDLEAATAEFFGRWLESPFRGRQGGTRFNNLLWLHLIARSYVPDIIIDSGTFRGASAWALSFACPRARVLSFDIDLSQVLARAPGVVYVEKDWSEFFLGARPDDRIFAYFDDHVDQVRRLIEAEQRECDLAIFDDDFPITAYYAMAPSPSVLPKIEFALDQELRDGVTLEWISGGAARAFRVDRRYLDRGLACIRRTERLPNTSAITGIHQTPFRLVSFYAPAHVT